MRINLVNNQSFSKQVDTLIDALTSEFSTEYDMSELVGRNYFISASSETREFMAEYLRSVGWAVHSYTTPVVEGRVWSQGYTIDENCDRMIAWKLANN